MTQVLHLSSRWNKFLVSLLISIQFFFPWVAGCHLIIWDVFHKTISSLLFSLWVFQQLRPSFCCNRALSRYCFPSFTTFHSYFCSGGIVMLLFSLLISVCQDHVQFLPFTVEVLSKLYQSYSFSILCNRSVVSSAQVLFTVSSLA